MYYGVKKERLFTNQQLLALLWPLLAVLLPRMGEAGLATAFAAAALLAGRGGAAVIARTLLLPLRRAGHPA